MRKAFFLMVLAALFVGATQSSAATITFNFEDGTDNGFGTGFGNDASASFAIVNIGGSKRMEVLDTASFQQASRESQGGADPFLLAINAAALDPTNYKISYDWYVDTSLSPGNYGTFLQLGTYLNSGAGGYVQDFPGVGKDVELTPAQLASGQVFSGTVSETLTQKYGALGSDFLAQTFMRFGLISNGNGTQAKVYYDNITIAPLTADPAGNPVPVPSAAVAGGSLVLSLGLLSRFRRRAGRGVNYALSRRRMLLLRAGGREIDREVHHV